MARPTSVTLDVADANLTGFASNVTGATFTITTTETSDGLAHQVSVKNDSATDHSAKTLDLVGTDADGRAQLETIAAPAGSATVESTKYFATLTSVTPSATIGSDTFDIGWVDEVASKTIPLNWRGPKVAYSVDVNGTLNYDVEITNDAIQDGATYTDQEAFHWQNSDVTDVVNATADAHGVEGYTPRACRLILNSYSSAADAKLTVVQSDA